MSTQLKQLLDKWIESGRVGVYYPRLRVVSLNGKPRITEAAAIAYLREFFKC